MTTSVGTEKDFAKAVYALCELDFEAVEAYETAINCLQNTQFKQKLIEFRNDNQRHIFALTNILLEKTGIAPEEPSIKKWLTKTKVLLADLISDKMILSAMLSNEEKTSEAYKQICDRQDKWPELESILKNGFLDEYSHKKWLQYVLETAW